MTSREKEITKAKEIAKQLSDFHHDYMHPAGRYDEPFPITHANIRALAGVSRVTRSLMYHLNAQLSEYGLSIMTCDKKLYLMSGYELSVIKFAYLNLTTKMNVDKEYTDKFLSILQSVQRGGSTWNNRRYSMIIDMDQKCRDLNAFLPAMR